MPTPLILMLVGTIVFFWWSSARAAAEHANRLARKACHDAGVQLIDHTVHAVRIRVRRNEDGRLGVERGFRFEYSEDGIERHIGHLVLRGGELRSFSGPTRAARQIDLHW